MAKKRSSLLKRLRHRLSIQPRRKDHDYVMHKSPASVLDVLSFQEVIDSESALNDVAAPTAIANLNTHPNDLVDKGMKDDGLVPREKLDFVLGKEVEKVPKSLIIAATNLQPAVDMDESSSQNPKEEMDVSASEAAAQEVDEDKMYAIGKQLVTESNTIKTVFSDSSAVNVDEVIAMDGGEAIVLSPSKMIQQNGNDILAARNSNKRVMIIAGVNKNRKGVIVGTKDKRHYKVDVGGDIKNVRMTSVRFLSSERDLETEILEQSPTIIPDIAPRAPTPIPLDLDSSKKTNDATTGNPEGATVVIEKGANKGRRARIVRSKGKMTFVVDIDGVGEKDVRKASVRILSSEVRDTFDTETKQPDCVAATLSSCSSSHSKKASTEVVTDAVSRRVEITGGSHSGTSGTIVSWNGKKTYVVDIDGVGQVNKRSGSVSFLDSASDPSSSTVTLKSGAKWRVADSLEGGTKFGTRLIAKRRLALSKPKRDATLLSHIFDSRIEINEIPLNAVETTEPFDRVVRDGYFKYELISTKVEADCDVNCGDFFKPKRVRLVYAQVSGGRLAPLSVQAELLKLADFSSLDPRKVMARLELLQSPACVLPNKEPGLHFLETNVVCSIEDRGYVGCGFICERLLDILCGGNPAAKRVVGIQVRIIVPRMGLFKGMLMRKLVRDGPPIQLPGSMQKVLASKHPGALDETAVLICKNGIHPSPKTTNEYMGRKLDPSLKPPPKSFKPKPLSEMILRLLRALEVPKEIVNEYGKKSLNASNCNHGWVVGLADPTDCLPAGHVFVTGMNRDQSVRKQVFVTRSPCLNTDDGRVIPVVTQKSENMCQEEWEWLNQLSFGGVVFANPKPGMKAMPEMIAGGDLDGDLYFICWDSVILTHVKAEPLPELRSEEEAAPLTPPIDDDDSWFTKAQYLMMDAGLVQSMGSLIGKLYSLSNKIADDSPLYKRDPDAIACADAYKQALEFGKHGGRVSLPEHLHEKLPSNLRQHVRSNI